jgi:hypothetical protein
MTTTIHTTWTAADGTIYQAPSAPAIRRALKAKGYESRINSRRFGYRVETVGGVVYASHISNGYGGDFSADVFRAGFDFQIDDSYTNHQGDTVVILSMIGRRIGRA